MGKIIRGVVAVVLMWILPGTAVAQPEISLLDGTVTVTERESLRPIITDGSSSIYLGRSETYLRISVTSKPLYVASLCICSAAGDRITVLHASAALGSVDYKMNGNRWVREGDFEWRMRDTSMTDRALNERRKYLAVHSWVATTMAMGEDGEVEFLLDPGLTEGNEFYLAAGLMPESDPDNIIPLPEHSAGACAASSLVAGSPEQSYPFIPEMWHKVTLSAPR